MDKEKAIREGYDPRHVIDPRKNGFRRGDVLSLDLPDPQDLIDRKGHGPPSRSSDEEVSLQAVYLRREPEPMPDVEDRNDLSVDVDDSEGYSRQVRERCHGNHRKDSIHRKDRERIALVMDQEDDQLKDGALQGRAHDAPGAPYSIACLVPNDSESNAQERNENRLIALAG